MGEGTKSAKSLFTSKLFLPFFLMLTLMGVAGAAIQKASNLLVMAQLDKSTAPIVKLISSFPVMLLIILFVFFLRKIPIQSWMLYVLLSFAIILAVVALWLIPNIVQSPSHKLATAIEFLFSGDLGHGLGEAVRQWRLSLVLLMLKFLSPALFSVIVWAFINQVTLFSESIKYYIPLAFLSSLPAFFLFRPIFSLLLLRVVPWTMRASWLSELLFLPFLHCLSFDGRARAFLWSDGQQVARKEQSFKQPLLLVAWHLLLLGLE
ncbi:MAG: hypothetical protein LVR00_04080 [Rhabdochlamydiaceae bacterium]|jgi:ATP/ADP translocase